MGGAKEMAIMILSDKADVSNRLKEYFQNPYSMTGEVDYLYRVRQKDLPHFKRQLQTNKERYGKNTLICEQQI
jgi:hypothetical protein